MSKNTIIVLFLVAIVAGAWFIPNRYISGLMSGFCICLLVLSWLGRRQLSKSVDIIEKKINDFNETN